MVKRGLGSMAANSLLVFTTLCLFAAQTSCLVHGPHPGAPSLAKARLSSPLAADSTLSSLHAKTDTLQVNSPTVTREKWEASQLFCGVLGCILARIFRDFLIQIGLNYDASDLDNIC
jgi:hypothetical protein